MAQWLTPDISLIGVHVQLWVLLVTGVMLLRFVYVSATRTDAQYARVA